MAVDSDLLASVLPGDDFTLLESTAVIGGAFDNAANGDELQFDFGADYIRFSVHYGAGSSFDPGDLVFSVVATSVVPEPTLAVLLAVTLLAAGLGLRRR